MNRKSFGSKSPGKLVPTVASALAFLPDALPPDIALSTRTLNLCERALVGLGELRAIIPALPNPQLLSQPFLRREAVLSSQIEGTYTRIGQLALFEVSEETSANQTDRLDAREVLNYVEALKLGFEMLNELPVCERIIKAVHERLMTGVRGEHQQPGQYRTMQNLIGRDADIRAARFVPPPPDEVPRAMRSLEKFIHSDSRFPFLAQLALVHYQFETIHPFCDGNGRVGRLLISLLLAAREFLPQPLLYFSAYLERHRDRYVDLMLRVSQKGEWEEWIFFFVTGVLEQSADAVARSRQLLDLREQCRARFQRKNSAAILMLIDSLFVSPATSINNVQKLLGTTFGTAQRHVATLESAGLLREVTGQQRGRVYLCDPIVAVLEAPSA